MRFFQPKNRNDICKIEEQRINEIKQKPMNRDGGVIIEWAKPILVILSVLVIVQLIGKVITGPRASLIAMQNAEITNLINDLDIKINQYKDKQAQYAAIDEYSYYTGNNEEDNNIAIDFFRNVCTWNNATEYEMIRAEMFEAGYKETDSFIRVLLPEQKMYYNSEEQKMHYSIDDNGESMAYEELIAYPLSANGTKKEYSGILKVSSKDVLHGGEECFGYVYIHYYIEDGKCLNIEAESLLEQ